MFTKLYIPTCVYVEDCNRETYMNDAYWAPEQKPPIGARPGHSAKTCGADFCACVWCEPQALLMYQYALSTHGPDVHFHCPCPDCTAAEVLQEFK